MFDFMLYFKRFQTVIPLSSLVFKNAFKQSHTKQILDIDLLIRKGKNAQQIKMELLYENENAIKH